MTFSDLERAGARAAQRVAPYRTILRAGIGAGKRGARRTTTGDNDMIDNDAQVALGDGITHAIGGSNPTHSRGGGHRGSST